MIIFFAVMGKLDILTNNCCTFLGRYKEKVRDLHKAHVQSVQRQGRNHVLLVYILVVW